MLVRKHIRKFAVKLFILMLMMVGVPFLVFAHINPYNYSIGLDDWWTFNDGDRSGSGDWNNGELVYDVVNRNNDMVITGTLQRAPSGMNRQAINFVISGCTPSTCHIDNSNYPIRENFTFYVVLAENYDNTKTILEQTGLFYVDKRDTGATSSSPVYIDLYVWNGSWVKIPNTNYVLNGGWAHNTFTIIREGDLWTVLAQSTLNQWNADNVVVANGTITGVATSGTSNLRFNYLSSSPYASSIDEFGVWNRSLSIKEVEYLTNCRSKFFYTLGTYGCSYLIYPFDPVANAIPTPSGFDVQADINSTEIISVDLRCTDYDGYDNVTGVVTLKKNGVFYDNCSKENMGWGVTETLCAFNMSGFFQNDVAEFYAYCDDSDNVSSIILNENRTVDSDQLPNDVPSINITNPLNNSLNNQSFDVGFSVSDNDNTTLFCSLYIDASLNSTKSSVANNSAQSFTSISNEGMHTFEVVCTDEIDNGSSGVYNYLIDTTQPFISSIEPVIFNTTTYTNDVMHIYGNTTNYQIVNVSIVILYPNATELYANETTSFLDPTVHTWDWNFNTSFMPNGDYEMFIYSEDLLSNINQKYITFEVGNCNPDWVCSGYSVCNISDLSSCDTVMDNNGCGQAYSGDYSEFSPQACNYCSYNIQQYNVTACINDTQTVCYQDVNFASCCQTTGFVSDCVYGNESIDCQVEACTIETGSGEDDISNAFIDLIMKFILSVNNLLP